MEERKGDERGGLGEPLPLPPLSGGADTRIKVPPASRARRRVGFSLLLQHNTARNLAMAATTRMATVGIWCLLLVQAAAGMRGLRGIRMVTTAGEVAPPRARLADQSWQWKGYNVRYQAAGQGNTGPSVLLVHGFGGNADHWRDNTAALAAAGMRVYAIDLLGYGKSDKPPPLEMAAACGEVARGGVVMGTDQHPLGSGYNFYTWADQLRDFASEVIADPRGALCVCNSVGSVAGLQAALDDSAAFRGVFLLDPSLRMLHVRRQNPLQVPLTSALQTVLRETPLGLAFFDAVAKPNAVRNVLRQAYGVRERVDDELIDVILTPGRAEGAARVFLDFISYSGGPLPEDLLAKLNGATTPVWIAWGENDPWEPIAQGRAYADYECVRRFVPLPGVGHCPQDEAPERINELVSAFAQEVFGAF